MKEDISKYEHNKIDGLAEAIKIRTKIKDLIVKYNLHPNIAIIQVGNDFASSKYVNNKLQVANNVCINVELIRFNNEITEYELIEKIKQLNNDKKVNGILVQLPLPANIDKFNVLASISPEKDIDGLTPLNIGLLHCANVVPYQVKDILDEKLDLGIISQIGRTKPFIPCTPFGCLHLITNLTSIYGKNAIVIGNSNLVGRPMSRLLTQAGATTLTLHSKSSFSENDKHGMFSKADIIVSATGFGQELFNVKPSCIIIDVAIRKNDDGKICGDLDYNRFIKTNKITPVPYGVGPMTISCLMINSYISCLKNMS